MPDLLRFRTPVQITTVPAPQQKPIILRGCPRCHGDLFRDALDRGWYVCFACAREYKGVAA